jgi:hypothetical protein
MLVAPPPPAPPQATDGDLRPVHDADPPPRVKGEMRVRGDIK